MIAELREGFVTQDSLAAAEQQASAAAAELEAANARNLGLCRSLEAEQAERASLASQLVQVAADAKAAEAANGELVRAAQRAAAEIAAHFASRRGSTDERRALSP
jgi:hypothetical protein